MSKYNLSENGRGTTQKRARQVFPVKLPLQNQIQILFL